MAQQIINVGAAPNDDTGDPFRTAFIKVNDNFTELYASVGGIATSNLEFNGNSVVATNTNGNVVLDPNGTGYVQIATGAQFAIDNSTPSTTAITGASDMVIGDGTGNRGVTVSVGSANTGAFYITDTDGVLHGGFDYSENTDTLSLYADGTAWLTIDSLGVLTTPRLQIDENIISTLDSNENLILDPAGTGSVEILGDLLVQGTTTTVNSVDMTIDDPVITVGGDTAPGSDDNKDRGVEFRWHNGSSAKVGFFGFDDSTGRFTFIPDATNTSEVFSGTPGDVEFGTVYGTFAGTGSTFDFITLSGNTISTNATNTDLELDPSGTGDVVIVSGTLVGDVTGNADTATLATTATTSTNVTVTNEASDTVTFPVFVNTATGDQLPHTNSSLVFNAASGTLSAITFSTSQLSMSGNVISSNLTNSNIELDPAGTGNVVIPSGNLELPTDPTTGDHVGNRDYNDARYASQTTTITGTSGLAGGGDLSTNRTITLDIDGLSDIAIASADSIAFSDNDDSGNPKKRAMSSVISDLDLATNSGVSGTYLPLAGGTLTGQLDVEFVSISGNTISTNATSADLELDASGAGNILMTVSNVGINNLNPTAFTNGASSLVIGDGSTDEGITVYTGTGSTGSFYFADGDTGSDDTRGGLTYNHSIETLALEANSTSVLTLTDTNATFNGNVTVGSNITNNDDTSTLVVTGATTVGGGPEIGFVGPSAGSNPNSITFSTNAAEYLRISGGFFTFPSANPVIQKGTATGSLIQSGGTAFNLGGGIRLYGESHVGRPSAVSIYSDSVETAVFDNNSIILNSTIEIVNSSINSLVTNEDLRFYTAGTGSFLFDDVVEVTGTTIKSITTNTDLTLDAEGTGGVTVTPDFTMSGLMHVSTTDSIAAAGSTQGTATALTTTFNRVTTATGGSADGVQLPTAVAGRYAIIRNDSGVTVMAWPATGDAIDGNGVNNEDSSGITDGSSRVYVAVDATTWYTVS